MDSSEDKISGCLAGLAIGDAMGASVKGLKPETIKQLFKNVDRYLDVKPHLGKGVKRYRMRGLYGAQTQLALCVGDSLLEDKKSAVRGIADRLTALSAGGPEGEFGVFRRPEGIFVRSVESLKNNEELLPSELSTQACNFAVMGIPSALFYKKPSTTLKRLWLESGLMMSRNNWEIAAVAAAGLVAMRCLQWNPGQWPDSRVSELLQELIESSEKITLNLQERFPEIFEGRDAQTIAAFTEMLKGLHAKRKKPQEEILQWVCEHAGGSVKQEIRHPSQASALTLIPLALTSMFNGNGDFKSTLAKALNRGRSAEKSGALLGAWLGALCGYTGIPQELKAGLVNAKEIKLRGDALSKRRKAKQSKDLYEMESGASAKNKEEEKKYLPATTPKPSRPALHLWDDDDDEEIEGMIPQKENKAEWRKFQKEKTKKKRDRRKNPVPEPYMEEDSL